MKTSNRKNAWATCRMVSEPSHHSTDWCVALTARRRPAYRQLSGGGKSCPNGRQNWTRRTYHLLGTMSVSAASFAFQISTKLLKASRL